MRGVTKNSVGNSIDQLVLFAIDKLAQEQRDGQTCNGLQAAIAAELKKAVDATGIPECGTPSDSLGRLLGLPFCREIGIEMIDGHLKIGGHLGGALGLGTN